MINPLNWVALIGLGILGWGIHTAARKRNSTFGRWIGIVFMALAVYLFFTDFSI